MMEVTITAFKRKVVVRALQILAGLIVVLAYGTLGFMVIEKMPAFDAFYMTVITMTTVGYGEIYPLHQEGRIFAVTLIFAGLIGSGISVAMITNLLFEEAMMELFKGRKMKQLLDKLRDHYIICGCGTTGESIARELAAQGEQVVMINQTPIDGELATKILFLQGDARADEILEKARIHAAKGLATTLTEDADNVFVTLTARSLNPELRIVSRFKDKDTEKKLGIAGCDQAVSPYRMGGQRLALALTNPAMQSILDASLSGEPSLNVRFAHVHVPEVSFLQGKTLRDSNIREYSMGALVVAIVDRRGVPHFNPSADTKMDSVRQLLVLGDDEQIMSLKTYLKDFTPEPQN